MKKIVISIVCLLGSVALLAGGHLVYLFTHREFGPADFAYPFFFRKSFLIPPLREEKKKISQVLNQKFYYLGCGKQMTCYESEDHLFVLKFFNPRVIIREKWLFDTQKLRHMSSLRWISHMYLKREERLMKYAKRYQIGFEQLPKETGIVYLHLDQNTALDGTLRLVDRDEKLHEIDLKAVPFVLQKKAELVASRFQRLKNEGRFKQIEQDIDQIYSLFLTRSQKGITDRIQTLHNNYGFTEEGPIQIDLGRINYDEKIKEAPEKEAQRVLSNAASRMSKRDSSFDSFFQAVLAKNTMAKGDEPTVLGSDRN